MSHPPGDGMLATSPGTIGPGPAEGHGGVHDRELTARLKAGDETAFRELVAEFGARLARLARTFSRNELVIEEAVQETWLAVIRGIHGFEGRAPLRAWVFSILANQARRLATREQRHAQLASGPAADDEEREPGMAAAGHWAVHPAPWGLENPESIMLSQETLQVVEQTVSDMPESQRQVVLLRDVEGLSTDEICNILDVSETNLRVLLHRGRARVRRALDRYMTEGVIGGTSRSRARNEA